MHTSRYLLLAIPLAALSCALSVRQDLLHAQTPTNVGVCMGNLKQIGQAMLMYANDWGGVLPTANQGDSGKAHWQVTNKWGQHHVFLPDALSKYLPGDAVFDCPVRNGVGRKDAAGDYGAMCAHDPQTTFARLVASSGVSAEQCMVCGSTLASVTHPDTKVMAFCNSLGLHQSTTDLAVVQGKTGGTPVVYVDGSVKYLSGGIAELARAALSPK